MGIATWRLQLRRRTLASSSTWGSAAVLAAGSWLRPRSMTNLWSEVLSELRTEQLEIPLAASRSLALGERAASMASKITQRLKLLPWQFLLRTARLESNKQSTI